MGTLHHAHNRSSFPLHSVLTPALPASNKEHGAISGREDHLEGQPPCWPDRSCTPFLPIRRHRPRCRHVVLCRSTNRSRNETQELTRSFAAVLPREEGRPRAAWMEASLGPLSLWESKRKRKA